MDKWSAPGAVNHFVAFLLTRLVVTVPVLQAPWICAVVTDSVNPVLFTTVFGMVATVSHNHFKVC